MKEELFQQGMSSSSHLWISDNRLDRIRLEIKVKDICFSGKSPFQKIDIFDTYEFGKVLVMGGSMVLTEMDEYIYHEMISHTALFTHPNPANVLIIGGGDGGVVREVVKHKSVKKITVIEIDKMVVDVCKKYFPQISIGLNDERVKIVYNDGSKYINETKDNFDVILVDSYDPMGPMQHLVGKGFFENVFERLNSDGIMVTQSQSPIAHNLFVKKIYKNLSTIFPICKLYLSYLPSYPSGLWSFVFCSKKYDALKDIRVKKDEELNLLTKYYNVDIHKASFILPNFVKGML